MAEPAPTRTLAVIEFNMRPVVWSRLEDLPARFDGWTANGCVGIARPQLRGVLRWLRPGNAPQIAIGTTKQLRG